MSNLLELRVGHSPPWHGSGRPDHPEGPHLGLGLDGGARREQGVDVGDAPGGRASTRVGTGRGRVAAWRGSRRCGRTAAPGRVRARRPGRRTSARSARCGCCAASLSGSTGATQASVPSKTSVHSASVRVRAIVAANSSRSAGCLAGSSRSGALSRDAEPVEEGGVELRLERRRPRGGGRRRSRRGRRTGRRRRAGWPRAARVARPAGQVAGAHRVEVGGAVDDRRVDDLARGRTTRASSRAASTPDDQVRRTAAEVADQVGRELRPGRVLAQPVQRAG